MKHFIYFFFFLTLTACVDRPVGSIYCRIPDEGWRKEDTLALTLVRDSLSRIPSGGNITWKVYIDVRHTNTFLYSNLVMRLFTPQSDTTVSLPLTDEQGMWRGHGLGYLYQFTHPVGLLRPDTSGSDTICFRAVSLMPDSILQGVHDIGIRIISQ